MSVVPVYVTMGGPRYSGYRRQMLDCGSSFGERYSGSTLT